MPIVAGTRAQTGLKAISERQSELVEKAREREAPEREEVALTEEENERFKILQYCSKLYDDARKARKPYETFDICWDLYIGNVWPTRWPVWRARITINKIRAFITFMQAIMTDNKPRLSVEPEYEGSEDAADLLRKLVDRDWDENDMQQKVSLFVLYGLIWGTGFMKIAYDPYANAGRGKHTACVVAPYKIYTNETATCIEDAEYLIHPEEQTMGWIRRNFPDKAHLVSRLRGSRSVDSRENDRDFIREGEYTQSMRIISAQNIDGNITAPQFSQPSPEYDGDRANETVEVQEFWIKDDTLESYERQKYENGKPKFKDAVNEQGESIFETTGWRAAISEIDGQVFMAPIRSVKQEPVMETAQRLKFPNGRLILIAGGVLLLRDIPAPFQTDGFPWAMWKDYDTGTFFGTGEPIALKDCQLASNRIVSQVYDILEKIGNPSYMLKKGGGVNAATVKNKPGLIIPMDDMDSLKPLDKPPIPREFFELFGIVQKGMAEISGINDSVMGALPAANTAFATMDQLQESGAAPIRLKVRNLETGLTRIGRLRVQLIQQWDNGERPLRVKAPHDEKVVPPASDFNVAFRRYTKPDLQGQVAFGIMPISSLSTSPAGTWNRWMMLLDKHLIDEIWWHSKFRIEGWRTELPRMLKERQQAEARDAALKAASKTKPGPSQQSNSGKQHARNRQGGAQRSNVPSRQSNAAIR